jgi:DNA-directed RNA polymerase specialized sigma24 family protein
MSDEMRHDRFQALLWQVQQGSHDAARELYETYVEHVLRGVRMRLWQRMRSRFDSQDFAQQVWASFFVEPASLPSFQTPEELVSYLMRMAANKVAGEGRHLQTQKNNIQRETRIDPLATAAGPHPASRDPTPSAVAVYHEQYDRLVGDQPPGVKRIVERRALGKTFDEIAAELEIDESTARRVMKRLQQQEELAEREMLAEREQGVRQVASVPGARVPGARVPGEGAREAIS